MSTVPTDIAVGSEEHDTHVRTQAFRVAPLLVAVLAALAIYWARDLEAGSLSQPGPGMWPIVVSVVLGIACLILVARDIAEDYETWTRGSLRVVSGIAVLAAFVALIGTLGFLVAAVLVLFVWMKVLAGEGWVISVALSVLGALALNYVFVDLFAVPFPPGLVVITAGGA